MIQWWFVFLYLMRWALASQNMSFFEFLSVSRIVTIGDSLTFGEVIHRENTKIVRNYHPYSKSLETKLKNDISNNMITSVTHRDVETANLILDSLRVFDNIRSLNYKAAIILSGYNDIFNNFKNDVIKNDPWAGNYSTPNTILHNIIKLHELFLKHEVNGVSTDSISFAVTLPQFRPSANEAIDMFRVQLNEGIRKFASRCKQRVVLIDAATLFSKVDGNSSVNMKYFSEGCNLSNEGYDALTNLIYSKLSKLVVTKLSKADRVAYLDRCFSNAYPLLNDIVNTTFMSVGDTINDEDMTPSDPQKKVYPTPHTRFLNLLLNGASWRKEEIVSVAVSKIHDSKSTDELLFRFDKDWKQYRNSVAEVSDGSKPIRMYAIYGGTNDIIGRRSVTTVINNIIAMHKIVLRSSFSSESSSSYSKYSTTMFTVAFTIPTINSKVKDPEIENNRLLVNDAIRQFADQCNQRVVLVDLEHYCNPCNDPSVQAKQFGVGIRVYNEMLKFFDVYHSQSRSSLLSDEEFYSKCFGDLNHAKTLVSQSSVPTVDVPKGPYRQYLLNPLLLLDNESILAFGDSLTAGTSAANGNLKHGNLKSDAYDFHPYTIALNITLNSPTNSPALVPELKNSNLSVHINVITSGRGGETTFHMISRLTEVISEMSESSSQTSLPKAFLLLGGTNDLTQGLNTPLVVQNILQMHQTVLTMDFSKRLRQRLLVNHTNSSVRPANVVSGKTKASATKINQNPNVISTNYTNSSETLEKLIIPRFTVAMTVPQIHWDRDPESMRQRRATINQEIKKFAKRCSQRVILFDMESLFDQSDPVNYKYWIGDGLHFSHVGYDRIGELLFEKIFRYLKKRAEDGSKNGNFESDEEFSKHCFES